MEISATVNDADELYGVDRTFVRIWHRPVKEQVRRHNQHTHGWPDIGTANTDSRLQSQEFNLRLDAIELSFSGGRLFDAYQQIDIDQVGLRLIGPDQLNRHGRMLSSHP